MKEFTVQVLATLVSTLIIFFATKLWKFVKTIPINFWQNLFFVVAVFATYLFDVNNQVIHFKILIWATKFDIMYIATLISLSICVYTTIDLSIFIKNEFFKK